MALRKPRACPRCGATGTVRRIVYGEPAIHSVQHAQRMAKTVVFGGCCCWGYERDDKWACVACEHQWGACPRKE